MPGSSRSEAREAFLEPLRRCLSCVTKAILLVSTSARPGDIEAFALSEDPLDLSSTVAGALRLRLRQQYRLVKDDAAPRSQRWHVSTAAYSYRLEGADGQELVSWHWHPQTGVNYPHAHVNTGPVITAKAHLPTGRVSVESVLRMLLLDLGVPPQRGDWAEVLDTAEAPFLAHRRWSGRSPDQG